jgi:hypothetical protein
MFFFKTSCGCFYYRTDQKIKITWKKAFSSPLLIVTTIAVVITIIPIVVALISSNRISSEPRAANIINGKYNVINGRIVENTTPSVIPTNQQAIPQNNVICPSSECNYQNACKPQNFTINGYTCLGGNTWKRPNGQTANIPKFGVAVEMNVLSPTPSNLVRGCIITLNYGDSSDPSLKTQALADITKIKDSIYSGDNAESIIFQIINDYIMNNSNPLHNQYNNLYQIQINPNFCFEEDPNFTGVKSKLESNYGISFDSLAGIFKQLKKGYVSEVVEITKSLKGEHVPSAYMVIASNE